ncbi:hypothetical protein [Alloscardovia macacae]|uniref:Topoisomerase II n=1 Tax=Alloscardovia macacae TaxID=1160091 RepID=A0A261F5Z3_9BIFI|nr:hypothetical protein [Alloscardovia macacae]OZG54541.1 topoisomerase II [Alloscardovia macacae]
MENFENTTMPMPAGPHSAGQSQNQGQAQGQDQDQTQPINPAYLQGAPTQAMPQAGQPQPAQGMPAQPGQPSQPGAAPYMPYTPYCGYPQPGTGYPGQPYAQPGVQAQPGSQPGQQVPFYAQTPRMAQPPLYRAADRPRVQVHLVNKYEDNKTPNVFVAFLAILGMVITAISFIVLDGYPDSLFIADNMRFFGMGAVLVVAGLVLVVAAVVAVVRGRMLRAKAAESEASPESETVGAAVAEPGEDDDDATVLMESQDPEESKGQEQEAL